MIHQGQQESLPYQWLLRAIGAYLDRHGADQATVIEKPNGFVVRYRPEPGSSEPCRVDFTFEELLDFKADMEARRTPRTPGMPESEEAPPIADRYQDVLRAVGYELEQVPAFIVLLDELENGFLLTYQYFNPRDNYLPHKHVTTVETSTRQALLDQAHARRKPEPEKPRWFTFREQ